MSVSFFPCLMRDLFPKIRRAQKDFDYRQVARTLSEHVRSPLIESVLTPNFLLFFFSHNTGRTQWEDPRKPKTSQDAQSMKSLNSSYSIQENQNDSMSLEDEGLFLSLQMHCIDARIFYKKLLIKNLRYPKIEKFLHWKYNILLYFPYDVNRNVLKQCLNIGNEVFTRAQAVNLKTVMNPLRNS